MSEPEKAFIVAPGFAGYDQIIAAYGIDPGRAFQCESLWEAVRGVFLNELQGIPAGVYTAQGRIGRRSDERQAAA